MTNNKVCCPPFDAVPWSDLTVEWENKPFIHDRVRCFLHIPIGIGKVVTRNMMRLEKSCAMPESMPIVLADECSPWESELYYEIAGEVPGVDTVSISGQCRAKAFDGHYRFAGKWMKELQALVVADGGQVGRQFSWYTTCPKCAKLHGHNWCIMFCEVL